MKKQKGAAVTATVAKWFTGVDAAEIIRIHTIAWDNKTANAGDNLIFEDEDGGSDFFRKSLDVAGDTGYVYFPDGIQLPKGKDIKVTLSGGTTDCWIWIGGESRGG